jgi:hypothetical protein
MSLWFLLSGGVCLAEANQDMSRTFENGSNPAAEKTGAELAKGLEVTLKGRPVSELVWIEQINR